MKNSKGITLIALVITIIILLILAGVSISLVIGENGVLNKATDSTLQSAIADEKEAVKMATTVAIMDGKINKDNLDTELNNRPGVGKYRTQLVTDDDGEEAIAITFTDSNRTYLVKADGSLKESDFAVAEPTRSEFFTIDTATGMISIVRDTSENHDGIGYYYNDAGEKILSEENIVIPEKINGITVTGINASTFDSAVNLKSIIIPNTITTIQWHAFRNCTNLTSIKIPNSVTYIGYQAFQGCSKLSSVTISNKVKDLQHVFRMCTSLTNVTIPSSVETLDYTFDGCTNLESVDFSNANNLKNLQGTFRNCINLDNIKLPNVLKTIYSYSFSGCTNLTNITIPNSVESIINTAFSGCTNLTSITIEEGSSLTVPEGKWGAENAVIY